MPDQCVFCGNDLTGVAQACIDCGESPLGNCCIEPDDHDCDHGGDSGGHQFRDEWSGGGDE